MARLDAEELHSMRERAVAAAREHSWERQKDAFVTEFARVIGRSS
jgi:hypothetical protein